VNRLEQLGPERLPNVALKSDVNAQVRVNALRDTLAFKNAFVVLIYDNKINDGMF